MDCKNDLPYFIVTYLSYVETVKGRTESTVIGYSKDIRLFLVFIKTYFNAVKLNLNGCDFNDAKSFVDVLKLDYDFNIILSDITLDDFKNIEFNDVLKFMLYCKRIRNNNNKTLARKSSTLRKLFEFLTVHEHYLETNPLSQLETPKSDKKLPKYLSLEQSVKLLNCIDGPYKARNYAIITLFLNCGMRLSELCSINYNHIDYNQKSITIFGKGRKERVVYLNDACIDAIQQYMKVRENSKAKDKSALFISRNGTRISPRMVEQIVSDLLDKSGLSGMGFSTHKLRHTAATLMYQYGDVDIRVLQAMLGHENLGTTQIYTHLSNEQLKKASASSPLANIKATDKK